MTRVARRPAGKPDFDEGISLDVRGTELALRMSQRIRWHQKRAQVLGAELKKLTSAARPAERAADEWRRDSAIEQVGKRIREHQERSVFLGFLRDHLRRRAVYRLRNSDLRLMEIMPDTVHWL